MAKSKKESKTNVKVSKNENEILNVQVHIVKNTSNKKETIHNTSFAYSNSESILDRITKISKAKNWINRIRNYSK